MKNFEYGYKDKIDNNIRDLFTDSGKVFLGYGKFSSSKFGEIINNKHLEIAELYYLSRISYIAFAALHFIGDSRNRYGNQRNYGRNEELYFDEFNTKEWFKKNWYDIINNYNEKDEGLYPHKAYEDEYKYPSLYRNAGYARSYELEKYPEIKQLLLDWVDEKIKNKNFVRPETCTLPDGTKTMWSEYDTTKWGTALIDKNYLIKFAEIEISRLKKLKQNYDCDIKYLEIFISNLNKK